ncbi:hypothetical protein BDZ88DRAFT_88386 [Geranomyces variabilis]|nr:hypothetical protein BDZ88DRAFT_88386 [Geranomyces variabilis]
MYTSPLSTHLFTTSTTITPTSTTPSFENVLNLAAHNSIGSPLTSMVPGYKDPYQVAFAMAYLFIWANYVYALVFGIIYQLVSLFRSRRGRVFAPPSSASTKVAPSSSSANVTSRLPPTLAADAPLSPTPANPALPPRPLRMPMDTALWSWLYTTIMILALGLLPFFLFLGPEKYIPGGVVRDPHSWWDTYTTLYIAVLKQPLEDLGFVAFFFVFMVINREIVILICLSLFVRWPKTPALVQITPTTSATGPSRPTSGRTGARSSVQVVGGVGISPDDSATGAIGGDTLSGPFQRYRQSTAFAAENLRERMAAAAGVTVEELNRKASMKSGKTCWDKPFVRILLADKPFY